jgi:NitT/TauT family transport system substrate-binding protein
VAVVPIADFTPLLVARDKGFFVEENLNVTWTTIAQGGIGVEAVYGGSAEVGAHSIFEPLIARSNGLDLVYLVGALRMNPAPPLPSGILVRNDGTVNTSRDLIGKKVSAGLINSPSYVHMREWLQRNAIDPAAVQFLEIPFPQMADALFQNRLDAVWNVEPFLTSMLKTGKAKIFAFPYHDNVPNMDITAYTVKESWARTNSDVAARFKRAIVKATNYVNAADKRERDEWISKFTGVKPEIVAEIVLPPFVSDFNVTSLKGNLEIAVRHRLAKPFNIEAMLWNAGQ